MISEVCIIMISPPHADPACRLFVHTSRPISVADKSKHHPYTSTGLGNWRLAERGSFRDGFYWPNYTIKWLTHWGWVTNICVSKLTIIGSDNGLSPDWRQAIIWTNDGILLNGSLGTNFNGILIEIRTFSFKKMCLKLPSGKMVDILSRHQCVNSSPPGQNGRHFAENIFQCIFLC